ncbi:putative zinc-binding metallopeptidase [Falsiroseomonas sp.]|uniref:zinc-binding metallopeptidase family protein n=1 Tax=Falsiroseomonas sp. TaxID=2870721 RepID=UPI0027214595|nr:putative zinc-binding metallopeptidase [Falsiroseomonas sp.]MDO9501972.1 putative zinc-binding metallopeptidase [Falsiroseomonas sp.]
MRLFACQNCGNLLHFENTVCEKCGLSLGFLPEAGRLSAFDADGLAMLDGKPRKPCANVAHDACNWFLPDDDAEDYCPACRLNAMVPDLSMPENLPLWRRMEMAKRRLIYTLDRLGLPHEGPELRFSFLADLDGQPPTMTGHEDGHITIALAEADDAEREARRTRLNEPFRTLLGHMRHEVGHWYFLVLVERAGRTEDFRALFGDESTDYAAALQAHYARPPNNDWRGDFISAYAAAHPHEDWAECFAHYLHMVDSLEMATSFGMKISPVLDREGVLETELDFSPYRAGMEEILNAWTPLTIAMNAMNRCMGTPDLYPFVLSAPVARKLGFIHEVVHHRPRSGT